MEYPNETEYIITGIFKRQEQQKFERSELFEHIVTFHEFPVIGGRFNFYDKLEKKWVTTSIVEDVTVDNGIVTVRTKNTEYTFKTIKEENQDGK